MRLMQSKLTGHGIDRAPSVFGAQLTNAQMLRPGQTVIVAADDFSWRTSSSLMVTVIFVFGQDPSTADVFYLSGGGGQGVLGLDWGSEDSRVRRLVDCLLDICQAEGWTLTGE